jgi:hypothetical protein
MPVLNRATTRKRVKAVVKKKEEEVEGIVPLIDDVI